MLRRSEWRKFGNGIESLRAILLVLISLAVSPLTLVLAYQFSSPVWGITISMCVGVVALHLISAALTEMSLHRRYFQDILDSMSEGVLVTDLVGFVTYANESARRLMDSPQKRICGEHIATLIIGSWDFEHNSGRIRREATFQSISGDSREVVIERSTLVDSHSEMRGMLFIVEDVTEKNKLAREVAEQRDVLARSERFSAIGTLGAIVAHKLSQPISAVRLFLQQVNREIESVTVSQLVRDNLRDSLAELERIASISRQMLHANQAKSVSERYDYCDGAAVEAAALKIRESLHDTARRRGVSIAVRSMCADLRVACSAMELEEILYCLVTNSIQAAPEEGGARVNIELTRVGESARITVTDTGKGIPPENLDRVFDYFFTTKPEGEGTGLGLAIVRHIAERYGGEVEVISAEGLGSRFMISLPVWKEVANSDDTEGLYC